tara:strand:- start:167 stop:355 length:189 start_codon:yes stop_codon:yes gene_type:complete
MKCSLVAWRDFGALPLDPSHVAVAVAAWGSVFSALRNRSQIPLEKLLSVPKITETPNDLCED